MKKWRFGNPIPTEAIIQAIAEMDSACPYSVAHLPAEAHLTERFQWKIPLESEDFLFGLGQNLGGINKRGRRYVSFCTDDPHHTEDKEALYAAHNVLYLIHAPDRVTGLYWDTPSKVTFDCGYLEADWLNVTAEGQGVHFYSFNETSLNDAIKTFRSLIGKPYMPPKWAFGYFQSRWGYASEADLLQVQSQFEAQSIPLEGVYVDIDYMERFKDFTIDKDRYPDFKGLVANFKEKGQYLIPIIDAGVKIETGYALYEEGIKDDHFVKDSEGNPYVAAVWPGRVHFPDFMQPKTQKWFGDWYQFLIEMGIEGIWNDMNEPAIFYDEDALNAAIEKALASKGENLDIYTYFALGDAFRQLSNKTDYYEKMKHTYDGQQYDNITLHNLYGFLMTKAADLGFIEHMKDKRPLILSRASTVGMHRHSGIWTGDNSSWWSHLLLNVKQMPALSAVGFLYSGADTGGFGGNATGELLSRWLQFSLFTPLLRNHAALGTREQEPYQFGESFTAINRDLIRIRYRLLPFLYSEFLRAYHEDLPLFSALIGHFSDSRCREIEDQIMLGDSIMLVPVVEPNRSGRHVYLPEPMTLITLGAYANRAKDYPKGDVYIPYPLEGLQFFIRSGYTLPVVKTGGNTANLKLDEVTWLGSMTLSKQMGHGSLAYSWYDDDGSTRNAIKLPAQIRLYSISDADSGPILVQTNEDLGLGSWHPNEGTNHIVSAIV